ncbi:MAG: dihydrofolate reductase, partial [Proteobacteria bacterium]|nr:dihydrofolate reductase [Pseudomonadota bacterium]
MRVSLIVAMAENRVIGLGGGMPWQIPADLRNFRQLTMGHPVVMGRKTYQAIGGALPGRANIVVTRDRNFRAADADVVHDLEEALVKAAAMAGIEGAEEVFVIGGAEIYAQAMDRAGRIYLTEVHRELPGDAFFPERAEGDWKESARRRNEPETDGGPAFSFVVLD